MKVKTIMKAFKQIFILIFCKTKKIVSSYFFPCKRASSFLSPSVFKTDIDRTIATLRVINQNHRKNFENHCGVKKIIF